MMNMLIIAVRMSVVCKEIVFKCTPEIYKTLLIFNVIIGSSRGGRLSVRSETSITLGLQVLLHLHIVKHVST